MIKSGHKTLGFFFLLSLFLMAFLAEGAVNDTSPNWIATPGGEEGEGGKDAEEFASAEIDDNQTRSESNYYEAPSISIKGEVIPGEDVVAAESTTVRDQADGPSGPSWYEETFSEANLLTLVDTWWKVLLWCLLLLILLSVCCYFTRCCYLVWDCCTDPFWGCCPRCACCETFLRVEKHAYEATKARLASEYYDGKAADVTVYEEGMPQLYDTQYFNWLHLFGLKTGGRCGEYSIAVNERSSREGERAALALGCGEDEIDFTEAQADSSFNSTSSHAGEVRAAKWSSNSDKNGLHIEHGHIGRYQALPNKEFELVPIVRNRDVHRLSNSFKRKSRSMESFGKEALRAAAQAEQQASSGGVISKSQADIHAVPPSAVSKSVSNKYSQTDLTIDTEPPAAGMVTSTVASSGYGTSRSLGGTPSPRAASLGGSTRGPTLCPLPKPPAAQPGSHQVKGHRRQRSISSAGAAHTTNSLPKTVFNTLSSDSNGVGAPPSFVNGHSQPVYGRNSFGYASPPEAMEKEILFGKETKILI